MRALLGIPAPQNHRPYDCSAKPLTLGKKDATGLPARYSCPWPTGLRHGGNGCATAARPVS